METRFIVIDDHACGDVHRIDQTESFFDTAFINRLLYVAGDVHKTAALRQIEPHFFSI